MNCMRCGVEISSNAFFCDECLADMEKHPVKPGTPVNLPQRDKVQPIKRTKRKFHKPDEQISILRKIVTWLLGITVVLAVALSITIYLLVTQANTNEYHSAPGQNYGTSASEMN